MTAASAMKTFTSREKMLSPGSRGGRCMMSGSAGAMPSASACSPARTRAIVPVHLYGQCVDVDAIRAAAPGIPILEDAAHAHGATYKGRKAGALGDLAAFSFYPSKVLGALGDGGILANRVDQSRGNSRVFQRVGH